MPNRIDLSTENSTLRELLDQADQWEDSPTKELSADQVAIINLKRVLDLSKGTERPVNECFICASGA